MANNRKPRSQSAMVNDHKPRSRSTMVDNRKPSSNDPRSQVEAKETMVKETEGMGRAKPHNIMAAKKINEEAKTLEVVLRKG